MHCLFFDLSVAAPKPKASVSSAGAWEERRAPSSLPAAVSCYSGGWPRRWVSWPQGRTRGCSALWWMLWEGREALGQEGSLTSGMAAGSCAASPLHPTLPQAPFMVHLCSLCRIFHQTSTNYGASSAFSKCKIWCALWPGMHHCGAPREEAEKGRAGPLCSGKYCQSHTAHGGWQSTPKIWDTAVLGWVPKTNQNFQLILFLFSSPNLPAGKLFPTRAIWGESGSDVRWTGALWAVTSLGPRGCDKEWGLECCVATPTSTPSRVCEPSTGEQAL